MYAVALGIMMLVLMLIPAMMTAIGCCARANGLLPTFMPRPPVCRNI